MMLLVRHEKDFELVVAFEQVAVRQALKMHLLDCIRRIRNELAQENLVIRVDAVNHEVEELARLRLEFMGFFRHSVSAFLFEGLFRKCPIDCRTHAIRSPPLRGGMGRVSGGGECRRYDITKSQTVQSKKLPSYYRLISTHRF